MNYKSVITLSWLLLVDNQRRLTSVSAGRLVSLLCLNRSDSGFGGLSGRDRSDPAAHAKSLCEIKKNSKE